MSSARSAADRLPRWGMPEGGPVVLLGVCLSLIVGLALARSGGSLPSIALIGGVAVVGFSPVVFSLGRLALPVWVALFGVLYPYARYPSGSPLITFDRLFLGSLLVAFALRHVRSRSARESAWFQRSLVLLVAVFLISAASASQRSSLAIWVEAFLLPLIVFWCAREAARDRRQLVSVTGAMALAGGSIALMGLAEHFAGLDFAPLVGAVDRFDAAIDTVRISGPFVAPEPFALVLMICLAGTLFWMRARGPAALVPGAIAVGLELSAIFLTYFRAAWLGAILILLLAFVGGKRSWTGRIAAIVAAGVGLLLVSTLAGHSETVETRLQNQSNINGRIATYERGLQLFERHPVFGVGFENFEVALHQIPQNSYGGVRGVTTAHSSLISTLAEQGLFGLIPVLACVVSLALALRALWARAKEKIDRDLALYATGATLAFLVMSATLTMIYYGPPNAMMALIAGLACGRLDLLRPEQSR